VGDERAGREITIKAGARDTVFKSQGLGASGTLIIYTADASPVPDSATTTDAPMIAEVRFGSGRAALEVEVDCAKGCKLSVPAGEIAVAAIYERDSEAGATEPDQRVGVVLSDGEHPGGVQPTRTKRLHGVLNATTASVKVPPRAANVAILTNSANAYGANLDLHLRRAPAGRTLASQSVTSSTPIVLPNGIRSVAIENRTGLTLSITLVFGLAL
jgi:hypothetical protein